jgi:Xaa-Pro dipeptidase
MNFSERLQAIRADMKAEGIDVLLALHDGSHFGGGANPFMVASGLRSMDDAAALIGRDGGGEIVVTPAWEADRAAETARHLEVTGADDLVAGLAGALKRHAPAGARIGVAGLSQMPWQTAGKVRELLPSEPRRADGLLEKHARRKTDEEIEAARKATEVAEKGYERMLELVRPGLREDELAVELRWYMKTLGGEDNFFMFNSGPHNRAVAPSSSRRLEPDDFVLTELSPIYAGQMTQICRTMYLGRASEEQRASYALLKRGFEAGLKAAGPGRPMADVCNAVDAVMEAEGYGEYCAPPWMRLRRRGHGLGFSSSQPGDVAPDNAIVLEPGMVFVLHPNQYMPKTGYMMCGEPVLITPTGAEALSKRRAELAEIPA